MDHAHSPKRIKEHATVVPTTISGVIAIVADVSESLFVKIGRGEMTDRMMMS